MLLVLTFYCTLKIFNLSNNNLFEKFYKTVHNFQTLILSKILKFYIPNFLSIKVSHVSMFKLNLNT